MAKNVKLGKVNRSFDGIERKESTAGLMALRIFVIMVIIVFIVVTAALFAYNFRKAAENPPPGSIAADNDISGEYYQIYDTDVSDELISYCGRLYPVSENVEPKLEQYNEKIRVNALMKESLDKLIDAAASDGIRLDVVRGYMTHSECEAEFKTLYLSFEDAGATVAEAQNRAADIFPPAKENEYRTGMLVKLSDMESEEFEATPAYTWLYRYGVNYGFINRYTPEKEPITGITGDLTVYRFVGTENALKMRSFGMCLEEYAEYCSARNK